MRKFGLGYVEDPVVGHEMYRGMMSIPYRRWAPGHPWSVVKIRFRKLPPRDGDGGKYLDVAGFPPRLFNTVALTERSPFVCITEGEIDAITAQVCGVPTVGVPGANSWQPYFSELFRGYESVYILADGDEPGMKFAGAVAQTLNNAKVIPFPDGEDVNSFVTERGPKALLERLK